MEKVIVVTLCLLANAVCVHAMPVASPLTSVLDIAMQGPPEQASGTDALNVKWTNVDFRCLDYPIAKAYVPNVCISEVKALKGVQCRPDWLKSQELVDYLNCAAKESTGDYKAYYEDIARRVR